MPGFFGRILLSVWLILAVTVMLTVTAARFLPAGDQQGSHYEEQLVALVAADLQEFLETIPGAEAEAIEEAVLARHVLDFDGLMQIYVLAPDGRDLLDRQVPRLLSEILHAENSIDGQHVNGRARIRIYAADLQGYVVAGYQTGFRLGRILVKPGARLLAFLIIIFISVVVAWWLSRFIVLPVKRMSEAGHRVAEGDLSVRVAPSVGRRGDDIAQLARDFDYMTERVSQLLDAQQRLMRDVSHELRSPLARMQALLSLETQKEAVDFELVDRMERELLRLDQLIGEILAFARLQAADSVLREQIILKNILAEIAANAELEGSANNIRIEVLCAQDLTLAADPKLLHSALENIVRNAVRYSPPEGRVEIVAEMHDRQLSIQITDQGPGVPDALLGSLFEPFVQLQEADATLHGPGGIGLAIARRAIQLHQGHIKASNAKEGGLLIDVVLPL
jgi:two-component system sensor histidine kinase CpxA